MLLILHAIRKIPVMNIKIIPISANMSGDQFNDLKNFISPYALKKNRANPINNPINILTIIFMLGPFAGLNFNQSVHPTKNVGRVTSALSFFEFSGHNSTGGKLI